MKPRSPYEYRVDIDRDGYLICDEEGDDVEPTRRYTTWLAAAARLREIVDEDRAAERQSAAEVPSPPHGEPSSNHDDLHDDYE